MQSAIVLVDGEHHPTVVADALRELSGRWRIVAVGFCGGGEKVAPEVLADPEPHYGYELTRGESPRDVLMRAIADSGGDVVIDLADEPEVTPERRLELVELALAAGLDYIAPDMDGHEMQHGHVDFAGPQIAVIGTGKRTGKTAVCCHLARLVNAAGGAPAVVSMGRGGPPQPLVEMPPVTLQTLVALSRSGVHAASDYLEDAVLGGVPTVGCRRIGGGVMGSPWSTNFIAGAQLAAGIDGVRTLLYEGSGAVVPPVEADRTITIVGPDGQATALGGPQRIMLGDLVLVRAGDARAAAAARNTTDARVAEFTMVPEPADPLPDDARVAFFSTAAEPPGGLHAVIASTALARRDELRRDLERAVAAGCDHFLTELKAAAIDTVAEAALAYGVRLVFVRNRPIAAGADSGTELDDLLLNIWRGAADG